MEQTNESLLAQIEALKAENMKLKSKGTSNGGFKVSEKGAVSVYGLGRYPVTLFKSQWENLLEKKEALLDFIKRNESSLAVKSN